MPDVVAEGSHPDHSPPVVQTCRGLRYEITDVAVPSMWGGYYIEDPRGQLHCSKRVLEPRMSCSRIHQRGKCQLMNVAEPLERAGVDSHSLVSI